VTARVADTAQMKLAKAMTEGGLQTAIMAYAKLRHWRAVHIRPARMKSGRIATPYEGDSGLPDLILARDQRVVLAELKRQADWQWKPGQQEWLAASGGYLWQPIDWLNGHVQEVLD
jgi:hypothetical protein